MAAVALKPIHRVRLKNLTALIDKRFNGNASEAARAIERSHTFMWQLMNGYRSIGEETARNIEAALGLGLNALDATMERTRALVAQHGDGTASQFHMVPVMRLDQFDAKPVSYRPCPDEGASEKTFCAEVVTESMAELQVGDLVFCDPKQATLATRKLFVVMEGRQQSVARVMQAKRVTERRWVFVTTSDAAKGERPLEAADVRVIGRVILVMRNLR